MKFSNVKLAKGIWWTISNPIIFPVDIYLLKVNNINSRAGCEICSKLTIKTPERQQWRRFGSFLLSLNIFHFFSSASTVNFEHLIATGCGSFKTNIKLTHFRPMLSFYTPWKVLWCSQEYKMKTFTGNGLYRSKYTMIFSIAWNRTFETRMT